MPKVDKSAQKKTSNSVRWTAAEEQHLLHMRDIKDFSFTAIADKLSRKTAVVERRYQKLKDEASLPANFSWTDILDDRIIAARRSNSTFREVAESLGLPMILVQDRFSVLRRRGKTPENSVSRGPGGKSWTDEEDEVLLRMYIALAEDAEIHKTAKLDKSLTMVSARRSFLIGGGHRDPNPSTMYRKLLIEFSRPNAAWTKQDVIDRKFTFGSWKSVRDPVE